MVRRTKIGVSQLLAATGADLLLFGFHVESEQYHYLTSFHFVSLRHFIEQTVGWKLEPSLVSTIDRPQER